MLGVLAQQRGTVAAVELLVAQPRWEGAGLRQLGLGPDAGDAGGGEVLGDGGGAGVVEAALGPDVAADEAVAPQRLLEPLPHQHGGVVRPSVAGAGEGTHDLDRLDPLLAQALGVEGARRRLEVGVRKERLHLSERSHRTKSHGRVAGAAAGCVARVG
ncbi:hypothetical protein GCM10007231_29820 [Nocardioides daphniae]|uniref:Uncharacterized protein n=1 Tax=Nocardioides daphniae TaxID=402297 RepID=A0ABQ1QJJ7_9ACTN|nr:hypothetical protein GCM10007231_29820 [Nocardioides daphniae]